jgi:hypothetical protein
MYQPSSFVDRTRVFVGASLARLSGRAVPDLERAKPLAGRDPRLDMFRGIALVMIFINHVPGTIFEDWTSRNFGFSDAAEAFVFMSGMAAGLAYSKGFHTGSAWLATVRVWARTRQLYFVHLSITLIVLAVFAAATIWFDAGKILTQNNLRVLTQQPLSALVGLPTLTYQLGYLNILPLYVVMLLATPLLLVVGLRQPFALLSCSIFVWMAAGQFRLNFPNFPQSGGWFFNPFAWQLLFVVGLLSGVAMKQGRTFVPYGQALFGLAAAFLVFVLLWMKIPPLANLGGRILHVLDQMGAPFYITAFDKTFLSLPRLLHALALFYVLASLSLVRQFAETALAAPFRLLGRAGLPVFATGTVLSMAIQAVKVAYPVAPYVDGLLLMAGLSLQIGLAWALGRTNETKRIAVRA